MYIRMLSDKYSNCLHCELTQLSMAEISREHYCVDSHWPRGCKLNILLLFLFESAYMGWKPPRKTSTWSSLIPRARLLDCKHTHTHTPIYIYIYIYISLSFASAQILTRSLYLRHVWYHIESIFTSYPYKWLNISYVSNFAEGYSNLRTLVSEAICFKTNRIYFWWN